MSEEERRRRKAATSKGMRNLAKRRTCRVCKRQNATTKVRDEQGFVIAKRCRWCKAEYAVRQEPTP